VVCRVAHERDLVSRAREYRSHDRGTHELKGVADDWQLYALYLVARSGREVGDELVGAAVEARAEAPGDVSEEPLGRRVLGSMVAVKARTPSAREASAAMPSVVLRPRDLVAVAARHDRDLRARDARRRAPSASDAAIVLGSSARDRRAEGVVVDLVDLRRAQLGQRRAVLWARGSAGARCAVRAPPSRTEQGLVIGPDSRMRISVPP
jgi:hypothetical protein